MGRGGCPQAGPAYVLPYNAEKGSTRLVALHRCLCSAPCFGCLRPSPASSSYKVPGTHDGSSSCSYGPYVRHALALVAATRTNENRASTGLPGVGGVSARHPSVRRAGTDEREGEPHARPTEVCSLSSPPTLKPRPDGTRKRPAPAGRDRDGRVVDPPYPTRDQLEQTSSFGKSVVSTDRRGKVPADRNRTRHRQRDEG